MDILNKFIFELHYIKDIYYDIGKLYYEINNTNVNILDVYNKNDIYLLIKINACCEHTQFRKIVKEIDYIDIPNLIEFYTDYIPENRVSTNINLVLDDIYNYKNYVNIVNQELMFISCHL